MKPPPDHDVDHLRQTLETTLSEDEFTAAAVRRRVQDLAATIADAPVAGAAPVLLDLPTGGLAERSPVPLPGEAQERYHLLGLAGSGTFGDVFLAKDLNIRRDVAIKFLKPGLSQDQTRITNFIREARITARLQHPGIVPVYDLEFTPDGRIYYSMRQIAGTSLAQALATRGAQLRTPGTCAGILLRAAEAIAYAHSKGVIHQDIKPDNIMLGEFGEVLVVDWGTSSVLDDLHAEGRSRLVGTPAYMSPEQAKCTGVDARSDVWCLGATLFHLLFGRYPLMADDPERFWEGKRAGRIDAPTPSELRGVSAPLVAIARKALLADPDQRYADAGALAEDLRKFQAGLAVSAHRDTLLGFLWRWHRRNVAAIWGAFAALAIILPCVWLLYAGWLREYATWGAPIISEDFAEPTWPERWHVHAGAAEVRDGHLVTTSRGPFFLLLRQPLSGSVAIEFDGEMLPGCPPCDLSVVWCEGPGPSQEGDPAQRLVNAHLLQTGAYANSFAIIYHPATNAAMAYHPFRLEHGRRYRIRAEVEDTRLSVHVDGRLLVETQVPLPFGQGQIGLYGYDVDKAFSNVRVYHKGVAERIPVTAIGDAFYREGSYASARAAYAEVVRSHAGRAIADNAQLRIGLCWWQEGDQDQARQAWTALAGTPAADQANIHLVAADFADGDHDTVLTTLETLARTGSAELRQQSAIRWSLFVGALRKERAPAALIDRYLDLADRVFADEAFLEFVIAQIYEQRGDWLGILRRCPSQDYVCAKALAALDRREEALERYPHITWVAAPILLDFGRPQEMLTHHRSDPRLAADALAMLGRFDEALKATAQYPEQQAQIRLAAGRFTEVLAFHPDDIVACLTAFAALGRLEEAPDFFAENRRACAQALLALRRYDEVLARFPGDQRACAEALNQLGRFADVIAAYPGSEAAGYAAFFRDPTAADLPSFPAADEKLVWVAATIAMYRGQADDVALRHVSNARLRGYAKLQAGRSAEILARYQRNRGLMASALNIEGRPQEVLSGYPDQLKACADAHALLAIAHAQNERWPEALAAAQAGLDIQRGSLFTQVLLAPLLRRLAAAPGSLADDLAPALVQRHRGDYQQGWCMAALLAGSIGEEDFLAQPFQPGVQARLQLVQALRAEVAGDADALERYRQWQALSTGQRGLDPVQDAFVSWRVEVLQKR